MKILYILPYIPYPLNSGGNQAVFNMIEAARKVHDISLLMRVNNQSDAKALEQLQELWSDITFYPFRPNSHPLDMIGYTEQSSIDTFKFKLCEKIHNSMTRKMRRQRLTHTREEMMQVNADLAMGKPTNFIRLNSTLNCQPLIAQPEFGDFVYEVSRKGFDVIQVEFYEFMPLVYFLPKDVKKIFVQQEIRYVRNRNEMTLFDKVTPLDSFRYEMLKDIEMSALARYDKIISLTEIDREKMLAENPSLDIYVSPAVVNIEQGKQREAVKASELVFVGGSDHFPNADAMVWFCHEVIPELRKLGDVPKINIVGVWRNEIKEMLSKLASEIHFTGFVDDLAEFINGKVSIIPIRIGSGMRMKIIESIFAASPIVTTSKGCEGLPTKHAENCLIADNAIDFAKEIRHMLDDVALQKQLVDNAKAMTQSLLNKEALCAKRLAVYDTL